jgi:glutamyl-tRNA synthetase
VTAVLAQRGISVDDTALLQRVAALFKDRCSTSWTWPTGRPCCSCHQRQQQDLIAHVSDAVRPACATWQTGLHALPTWDKPTITAALTRRSPLTSLKMPQLAPPSGC